MRWKEILEEMEKKIGKEETGEVSFIDLEKLSADITEVRKKIFELESALLEHLGESEKLRSKIAAISEVIRTTEYLARKTSQLEDIIEKEFSEKILQLEKKLNALSVFLEEKVRSLTAEKFDVVMDMDKRLSFLEDQVDKLFATTGFIEKSRFLRELTEKVERSESTLSTVSQEFRKLKEELNKKFSTMEKSDRIKKLMSELREIRGRLNNLEKRLSMIKEKVQKKDTKEIKIEEVAGKLVKKELKKLKPHQIMEKGVKLLE